MSDVGTRPCEVCGRPRPDDDSPRISHDDGEKGGCLHCTHNAWLKFNIPYGVIILVVLCFVAPWREHIAEIIVMIVLIGLGCTYLFFRTRRPPE